MNRHNSDREISASHQHYRILGVNPLATAEQIKSRYRELALRHHPDQNKGSPEAQALFITIRNAWEILGNPEKKKKYDSYLAARVAPPPSAPGGTRQTVARKPSHGHQASGDLPKGSNAFSGGMAREAGQSMETLLWDIDDLARQRSYGYMNYLEYRKIMFQILCCLYRWILRPSGYTEIILEKLNLEQAGAATLADRIYRIDASRLQFPLQGISEFWYLLRQPLETWLKNLDTLPWDAPIPGTPLRIMDAWIEAQNCITHYLGGIRQLQNVYQSKLEPYVSALPGFEL